MTSGIGDLARNLVLQRQTGALKRDSARLAGELATGRAADPARALRGDVAVLGALDATAAQAAARATALVQTGRSLALMQGAIAQVGAAAGAVLSRATSLGLAPSEGAVRATAAEAAGRLTDAVAVINLRDAGRSLFAGAAPDATALRDAGAILAGAAAAADAAGATDADGIAAAVRAWFDDPAGFVASAYGGGGARGPIPLGGGAALAPSADATDPGLRATIEGLVLVALSGRSSADPSTMRGLVEAGSVSLRGASDARIALAERLGLAEARVESARIGAEAEAAALARTRGELLAADPFATASNLEAAERQIELLHAVTARVGRLTLADFLR